FFDINCLFFLSFFILGIVFFWGLWVLVVLEPFFEVKNNIIKKTSPVALTITGCNLSFFNPSAWV
ncbi:hypothetical protein ACVGV7_12165, partial [Enterobacter intestinihominis]